MAEIKYSIVIPALQEYENLKILLPEIKALQEVQGPIEILVIDSHEELDSTLALCRELGVRHLRRSAGNSFGDAIRVGIEAAKGEWILFMDGDGSHPPSFIPDLLRHCSTHDIVIASRYVQGGGSENPWHLKFQSKFLNSLFRACTGSKIRDFSNNFRAYRASLIRDLNLRSGHFDIVEEIFLSVLKKDGQVRICEVPFHFRRRMRGESKRNLPGSLLHYLRILVKGVE